MRVLYLCADTGIDVLGRKGAAIHVREMIAAFSRAGHVVELVAPRLSKDGMPPARVAATVKRFRVPDDVQSVKQQLDGWCDHHRPGTSLPKDIRRVLYDRQLVEHLDVAYRDDPPDLIYARASLLSSAGVELAAATGTPFIVELNAPLGQEQLAYRQGALGDVYLALERELLGAATVVTVVSKGLADHVRELGVPNERILVMENAIDPARFHPDVKPRSMSRSLKTGPVLGFVGGLRGWHGVEVLPDVLALVQNHHPAAQLVVAGDGPLAPDIVRRAEQCGVADSVIMLGAVDHDDIPGLIRSFDVAIAPYPDLTHDFYFSPLKLYEYLGCGVPVVASAVGQIDEVLTDRVTARLTPPGDIAALAAACIELLDDPVAAGQMAATGARVVHERFTWDRNASAVMEAVGDRAVASSPRHCITP